MSWRCVGWTAILVGCMPEMVPSEAPPPVRGFDITGEPIAYRAEPYTANIAMPVPPAPPSGVSVWVPFSNGPIGSGSCPGAIAPDCLDITGVIDLQGPVTTTGNGQATITYDVPAIHRSHDLSMQAIVLAGGVAYLSSPFQAAVASPPPLFGVEQDTDTLWQLDLLTQNATPVGALGFDNPTSLAACGFGLAAQVLFATDEVAPPLTSTLYAVDPLTGLASAIGSVGHRIVGMACDGFRGDLLGITDLGDVVDIDTLVGQGTIVGNPGFTDPGAIAYLTATDTWYVSEDDTDSLYSLDPVSGVANLVGSFGFNGVQGLAAHDSGVLYGVSQGTGELLWIDPATGAATAAWPVPNNSFSGISF